MARWKLYLYAGLAVLATGVFATYALAVAPKARTSYELAVLVFAASAAGIGWLGVVVAWLTYRLEAGKVPRPTSRSSTKASSPSASQRRSTSPSRPRTSRLASRPSAEGLRERYPRPPTPTSQGRRCERHRRAVGRTDHPAEQGGHRSLSRQDRPLPAGPRRVAARVRPLRGILEQVRPHRACFHEPQGRRAS